MTCSFDRFSTRYGHFPESLRLEMLSESRKMFEFGYNCYMKCAFPQDELDPGWFFLTFFVCFTPRFSPNKEIHSVMWNN